MQNKNDTLPLLYREYWVLINVVHTCLFFFLCFHRLSSTAAKLSLVVHEFKVLSVIHSDYDGTAAGHSPGTSLLTLVYPPPHLIDSGNERKTRGGLYSQWPPSMSTQQWTIFVPSGEAGELYLYLLLSPKLQLNSLAIAISLTTIIYQSLERLFSSLCCPLMVMVNVQVKDLWDRCGHGHLTSQTTASWPQKSNTPFFVTIFINWKVYATNSQFPETRSSDYSSSPLLASPSSSSS